MDVLRGSWKFIAAGAALYVIAIVVGVVWRVFGEVKILFDIVFGTQFRSNG